MKDDREKDAASEAGHAPADSTHRDPGPPGPGDNPRRPTGAHSGREIGGRKGPDPTRYGDWEKAGRCIDF